MAGGGQRRWTHEFFGDCKMSGRASKSDGKGAAEEVEVEPEPYDTTPPSSATSYDPTVFQRPHPADRGGGDGKPRKGGGKAKGESNDEVKDKSKAKGKGKGGLSLDRCGWCDTEGANKTCTQCRSVVYCSPACQKVSRT